VPLFYLEPGVTPIDSYIEKMVGLACEIADAHGASLFLVDGAVLRPYIIYNLPEAYIDGIGEVRVGAQCCGRAVESKKPWVVTDMLQDPLFADGRDGAANSLITAAFSVPVFDDQSGEVIASLACHYAKAYTPSALDIERNQHFARLIGITLKGRGPVTLKRPIFAFAPGKAPQPAAAVAHPE
jgi:GAF domain-containing protein